MGQLTYLKQLQMYPFPHHLSFKEIFHQKTKICRKLHLHILFKTMIFIFSEKFLQLPAAFPAQKCDSGGQYLRLQWPVFVAVTTLPFFGSDFFSSQSLFSFDDSTIGASVICDRNFSLDSALVNDSIVCCFLVSPKRRL